MAGVRGGHARVGPSTPGWLVQPLGLPYANSSDMYHGATPAWPGTGVATLHNAHALACNLDLGLVSK